MNRQNTIQKFIEEAWDYDEEFLTEHQRRLLVGRGWLQEWVPVYFQDLVDRYQGSCNSLSWKDQDFLEEFDLFQDLDNIQFQCDFCGWWYETCEQGESNTGDMICQDCCEDMDEEDEEEDD